MQPRPPIQYHIIKEPQVYDADLQGPQRLALAEQPEGNGTGFVWDQDGHIVTNFHVLAGALQSLGGTKPNGSQKVAQVTLLGELSFLSTLTMYHRKAWQEVCLAVLLVDRLLSGMTSLQHCLSC